MIIEEKGTNHFEPPHLNWLLTKFLAVYSVLS